MRAKRSIIRNFAVAAVLTMAGASATQADGLPDPFSPTYTEDLLRYSEQLAGEVDGWFEPDPARPAAPAYDNPYGDFSAAMLERMREQDAVLEACEAGDAQACAQRGEVLEQMQRDTRGLGVITGTGGAYAHETDVRNQIRREELYRKSREWGYTASDIVQ